MEERPAPALGGAPGPAGAPEAGPGALHGCVRCGARIKVSDSMCEACNPLGLRAPSATQAHGIAFAGIVAAVVVLAVLARATISGVGPFRSAVTSVVPDPDGLRVTVAVTNEGSEPGTTTCRIDDPAVGGISPDAIFVQSPQVGPGATVAFDVVVGTLGDEVRTLRADCSG